VDSRKAGIVGADLRRLTFSKRALILLTSAPTIPESAVLKKRWDLPGSAFEVLIHAKKLDMQG